MCGILRPGRTDEYVERLDTDALEALLRMAPRLTLLEADVECNELALAHRMLRNRRRARRCACAPLSTTTNKRTRMRPQWWRLQPTSLLTRICNGWFWVTLLSTRPLHWMRWWTQR